MRRLTEKEVIFTITIEAESLHIEGNYLASGDPVADKESSDYIRAQLDEGNDWAWCAITVTADWDGHKGTSHVGACSYPSKAEFLKDGYYHDLKMEALENLNDNLDQIEASIRRLMDQSL